MSSPVALVALTVKLDVPTADGVPEITPAVERVKPAGNVPVLLHVIGVLPVAVSVWLYGVPTVPPANVVVVMVGATGAAIVIDRSFVTLPVALVALTLKLNVFATVGVPEITPAVEIVKLVGNVPLSRVHVIVASPVAVSVWLYAVPTVPPANVVVVMVGAVPSPLPLLLLLLLFPLPSSQVMKANPIIAARAIIAKSLFVFI